MSLTIDSARFGRVEIDADSVIEFPDGLIGLAGTRWALIATAPDHPLMWLHCVDDPTVSLPVAEPHRFFARYAVELTDEDAERLAVDAQTPMDVYVTVTAAAALEAFTANQRAPILVRDGRGHQVINQAPGCELRAPLFAEALAQSSAA